MWESLAVPSLTNVQWVKTVHLNEMQIWMRHYCNHNSSFKIILCEYTRFLRNLTFVTELAAPLLSHHSPHLFSLLPPPDSEWRKVLWSEAVCSNWRHSWWFHAIRVTHYLWRKLSQETKQIYRLLGLKCSQLWHLNWICSPWKMYYHLTLFSLCYFTQSKFWKMTPNFFLKQTPLTNKFISQWQLLITAHAPFFLITAIYLTSTLGKQPT